MDAITAGKCNERVTSVKQKKIKYTIDSLGIERPDVVSGRSFLFVRDGDAFPAAPGLDHGRLSQLLLQTLPAPM